MRILQVITKRQLRGAEMFASQLSAEFTRAGHEVMIVALQTSAEFPTVEGVTYIDIHTEGTSRWLSFKAWKQFSDLVKQWKPNVVQANASETLKFCVLSRLFFGWRAVLFYRNANKASDFIRSTASRLVNKWLANRVDYIISVSETCRVDFVNTFGVLTARTVMIPIGTVISETGKTNEQKTSATPYWINVASLVPEKNHHGLLSIFKQYRDSGGKAALYIVGDGRLRQSLVQKAETMGLTSSVNFLGYRRDALDLIRGAEGLLLPSHIEGLPGVILEAMACKVPVIAYDVGGISEVIEDQITGRLIRLNDEDSFTKAISTLDRDPARRHEMIARAYDRCVKQFDIAIVARDFLKFYTDKVTKSHS